MSDPHADPPDPGMLDEIARRVLWLAVRMVDVANREWGLGDGVRQSLDRPVPQARVPQRKALFASRLAHLSAPLRPHAAGAVRAAAR